MRAGLETETRGCIVGTPATSYGRAHSAHRDIRQAILFCNCAPAFTCITIVYRYMKQCCTSKKMQCSHISFFANNKSWRAGAPTTISGAPTTVSGAPIAVSGAPIVTSSPPPAIAAAPVASPPSLLEEVKQELKVQFLTLCRTLAQQKHLLSAWRR